MSDDPFTPAELEAGTRALVDLPRHLLPTTREQAHAVLAAVLPLHAARVRAEGRGYVRDGETPCGTPHPEGGTPCQLHPSHSTHVRPASGGCDAWGGERAWPAIARAHATTPGDDQKGGRDG